VVDFKALSEHHKRADEWATAIIAEIRPPGEMPSDKEAVNAISKALRDAYRQGKLGRKLVAE
jgi:hypothetical protein